MFSLYLLNFGTGLRTDLGKQRKCGHLRVSVVLHCSKYFGYYTKANKCVKYVLFNLEVVLKKYKNHIVSIYQVHMVFRSIHLYF